MQARSIILVAYVLVMAGGQAQGAARTGALEVREGNAGVPCFTIPESEERRSGAPQFKSISVAEAGPGSKTVMWTMAMSTPRTFPVSFRMCIPYAGRLPVLPQTPAAALQPDRPYEVTIDVREGKVADAPRQYRTRFCLVSQGQGQGHEHGKSRVRNLGPAVPSARSRLSCPA